MGSKPLRSFVKGVIWEFLGVLILFLLTRSWRISLIYIIIRIGFYFVYERIWKKIKWMKYPNNYKR